PRLVRFLVTDRPPTVVVEVVRATQTVRSPHIVDLLLLLLLDPSKDVRDAAQRALFARFGAKAPRPPRLATSAYPAKPYRDPLGDVRAWWVRERDHLDAPR